MRAEARRAAAVPPSAHVWTRGVANCVSTGLARLDVAASELSTSGLAPLPAVASAEPMPAAEVAHDDELSVAVSGLVDTTSGIDARAALRHGAAAEGIASNVRVPAAVTQASPVRDTLTGGACQHGERAVAVAGLVDEASPELEAQDVHVRPSFARAASIASATA